MTRPAMIFAAGFGTRMRPLTDTMPKPMIPVAGRPLLDHTLDLIDAAAAGPVVINAHYLADHIAKHLANTPHVIQIEDPILETGGGLKRAAADLAAPTCFTLNSDAIWAGPNPLNVLEQNWSDDMGALLLLQHVDQVAGRAPPGDFHMDPSGKLRRGGDWVFLGAQITTLAPVTARPETVFSLNVVWDDLIEQGRVFGAAYDGGWCDVGRPENIAKAEQMMLNRHV